MAPECLRVVHVAACWRKYLAAISKSKVSAAAAEASQLGHKQQVTQFSPKAAKKADNIIVVRRQVGLWSHRRAVVTRSGAADGPKLQRLGQRQCNKTAGSAALSGIPLLMALWPPRHN